MNLKGKKGLFCTIFFVFDHNPKLLRTTQMKAFERYFLVVRFIVFEKGGSDLKVHGWYA